MNAHLLWLTRQSTFIMKFFIFFDWQQNEIFNETQSETPITLYIATTNSSKSSALTMQYPIIERNVQAGPIKIRINFNVLANKLESNLAGNVPSIFINNCIWFKTFNFILSCEQKSTWKLNFKIWFYTEHIS